ncbi:type I secretion C-terminal target domain-containing protein, partial [Vogesella indigofera]|uniref:type I secretion C-terminal target domain-containing protein n=1 Tax=Vogesella indigofera TaxID=45465 RepID=UPI00234FAE59
YSLSDNAGGRFAIDASSGIVTVAGALDYETATSHSITVLASSADGSSNSQSFTIAVTDVDDTAPYVTSITGISFEQGNNGTARFTVTFSESVSGVNASAFTLFGSAMTSAGGIPTISQVSGSGSSWIVTVNYDSRNNANGDGGKTLGLNLSANTSIQDGSGIVATATSYSTPQVANLAPAGIAGEEINLALPSPADKQGLVTLTISNLPAGWSLSEGSRNIDGIWTVATEDPSSLTVTTPADFAGALVLEVSMSWSNTDGSSGNATVYDNVEAYTPGSPIFALTTDDNLTGSSTADTFVFARPIGNNVIHRFDVGTDKVDLIGFAGVASMADLSIVNDDNGNAVVSISSGQSITLKGVDAALLTAANFQFDVTPVLHNAGTLTIADGAIMPLGGVIDNSGTIALAAAGSDTVLELLFPAAELSGGGQLLLSDSAQNVIVGGTADTVLHNVDNTIAGAGQLGAGQLQLLNQGTIVASGNNALVIDTGSHAVDNRGTLAATGSGGLLIESDLLNSGVLWANHGNVTVQGDVSGDGEAVISGAAVLALEGAVVQAQSVQFADDASGTLQLANATAFDGSISGFDAGNRLALLDVAFVANSQLHYLANDDGSGGRLTVSDGINSAQLALDGVYTASGMQAGATGGSELSYSAPAVSHVMQGGLADDTLISGAANDVLAGGKGNDTLQGGVGVDTFSWQLADLSEGVASRDVISDFDNRSVAEGGDIIDLHDLLPADNDLLAASLHFRLEDGSTVIEVSPLGDSQASQSIVLSGVDLLHDASSGQLLSDHDILQKMLDSGKLRHD